MNILSQLATKALAATNAGNQQLDADEPDQADKVFCI
jgi:hypothetical protein